MREAGATRSGATATEAILTEAMKRFGTNKMLNHKDTKTSGFTKNKSLLR